LFEVKQQQLGFPVNISYKLKQPRKYNSGNRIWASDAAHLMVMALTCSSRRGVVDMKSDHPQEHVSQLDQWMQSFSLV